MQQTGKDAERRFQRPQAEWVDRTQGARACLQRGSQLHCRKQPVAPRRVYDGRKQRVLVLTVAGHGTSKATRQVSLTLNDRAIETKSVVKFPRTAAARWSSIRSTFPTGATRAWPRLDSADQLAADDVSLFRRGPRRSAAGALCFLRRTAQACCTSARRSMPSGETAFDLQPVDVLANLEYKSFEVRLPSC